MQLDSLKRKPANVNKVPKKDQPINLAVRLEKIELGNENRPSFFHGFTVEGNEPVSVRMMTKDEGVAVNLRNGEDVEACKARLHAQYVGTGEAHRPRPAEIANENHKTHCKAGGILMFQKTLRNEDGTYRAHWVETIEKAPGAGCDKLMATVRIEDIRDQQDRTKIIGTSVVADVVYPEKAVILNGENVLPTLQATFSNRDGEEKRKPFMFVRLIDAESGKLVLDPARANAKYNQIERKDLDSGETFKAHEAADASDSIKHLMRPDQTTTDGMVIRAAVFGLGTEPGYPVYDDQINASVREDLNKITDAVRSGALVVEAIPGERISAGPATRASIIKAAANANNPINTVFVKKDDNGRVEYRKFCPTYLTTKIGADGHRMFTKAVTAECYPNGRGIKALATANDHKANAQAAKERVAQEQAAEADALPFDPSAIDGSSHDEIESRLAASSAALDAEMS